MFISIKIFHVSLIETLTYLNISLLLLKILCPMMCQINRKGIYINTVAIQEEEEKRISSPPSQYIV